MPRGRKEKTGSIQRDPVYSTDDFRMYCFKVMPCSKHFSHDWTECPFAHPGEKATRRDPRLHTYVGIECPNVKNEASGCPRSDSCPFAHNVFECWLHPSRYRTQMCNEPATCRRKICFFAHSPDELRQPTAVDKNIQIGKTTTTTAPKRMSATNESTNTTTIGATTAAAVRVSAPIPPPVPDYRRQSCDGRVSKAQRVISADLPPKPRMSLDSATRSAAKMHQTTHVVPKVVVNSQQGALQDQLNTITSIIQQQQHHQQQQQQQNFNSFDLAAALERLSVTGNQSMMSVPTAHTLDASGLQQSQQLNNLLMVLLEQHLQNSSTGPPLLSNGHCVGGGATGLSPALAAAILQTDTNLLNTSRGGGGGGIAPNVNNHHHHLNYNNNSSIAGASSNSSSSSSSLSNNPYLLQQLQMAQTLGGLSAGLRSSLDSSLSTGSGNRMPTRVSYDAMVSTPGAFQQLNEFQNFNSIPPRNLNESLSSPELVLPPPNQTRSSTESSYTESYGHWSMDAGILDALKPSEVTGLGKKELGVDQYPVDDFIGFNQGRDTFSMANTMSQGLGGGQHPVSSPNVNLENWSLN
eukprot:g5941.t1